MKGAQLPERTANNRILVRFPHPAEMAGEVGQSRRNSPGANRHFTSRTIAIDARGSGSQTQTLSPLTKQSKGTQDVICPSRKRSRRSVASVLLVISICINVAFVVLAAYFSFVFFDKDSGISYCGTSDRWNYYDNNTFVHQTSVFRDLQKSEIREVLRFMYNHKSLKLVPSIDANLTTNFIYSIELNIPDKQQVTMYMDRNGSRPSREAKVVVFIADPKRPSVDQYIVGPLPKPYKLSKSTIAPSIDYQVRQMTFPEMWQIYQTMLRFDRLHEILEELYGATLFNCITGNIKRCIVAHDMPIQSTKSSERRIRIALFYDIEYFTLYPIDLQFIINVHSFNSSEWLIEEIWHGSKIYHSVKEFIHSYFNGNITKSNRKFPKPDSIQSGLNKASIDKNYTYRTGPRLHEMDGKRYMVNDQSVRYMKWEFCWTMSLARGPMLFDIRFDHERIVYELGISEIGLVYLGETPAFSRTSSSFTSIGLGSNSAGLIPGTDCPEDAVMLNTTLATEDFPEGAIFPNVACVFEYQLSRPLRRHYSNSVTRGGLFYEGLKNFVLVFRTILVINNFDYILDYTFFGNGALEVSAVPTGFPFSEPYTKEAERGVKHDNFSSRLIYHTVFHFKVDIDIHGSKNRYQTIGNKIDSMDGPQKTTKLNEYEAVYEWDDDFPEYHIIINEKSLNGLGHPRGYRIHLPNYAWHGLGNDSALSWSQYRLAITKRKSDEQTSSSVHAAFDAGDPVVDFRKFIDGENIVDEDLVAWITLGSLNIPHTEDIPNVATAGGEQSFMLVPFNYFSRDPSADSPDAIRLEAKDQLSHQDGVAIERSVSPDEDKECKMRAYSYSKLLGKSSTVFHTIIDE